jgi:hypothetical protein
MEVRSYVAGPLRDVKGDLRQYKEWKRLVQIICDEHRAKLEELKRRCVHLLRKGHRNAAAKKSLMDFAQGLHPSESKGLMDALTTALLEEVCGAPYARSRAISSRM